MGLGALWILALVHLSRGEPSGAHTEEATDVRLVDEHGSDVLAQARAEHRQREGFQPEAHALKLSFRAHGRDFDYKLMRRSVVAAGAVVSVDGKSELKHAEAHAFRSPTHDAVLSIVGRSFHGAVRVGPAMYDVEADHGSGRLHVTRITGVPGELGGVFLNGTVTSSSAVAEDVVAPNGSVQGDGRRLKFAPDEVDQWTSCYHQDGIVRRFKFGAAIGSKLFHKRLSGDVNVASQWMQSLVAKSNMVYEPQMHVVLEVGYLHIVQDHNGAPDWDEGDDCPFTINDQLDKWSKWNFPNQDMGVWHVFDDCFPGGGTIGLAYVGVLCNGRSGSRNWNTGVNWYSSNTWHTFAHEMGHNFGGGHSFELGQGNTGGIMDYGDGTLDGIYQFNSQFRKEEMCNEINSRVHSCSAFSHYHATCGNGLVEPGEDCECTEWNYQDIGGTGETSCTGCCNCKFESGKQCVADTECCSSSGMFKPAGEACSGLGGAKGFCSEGVCQTDIVCNKYPDYFGDFCGFHSDNECKMSCKRNGQCDKLGGWASGGKPLNHVPDGTPCGSGDQGACKDGTCQYGNIVGIVTDVTYEPGEIIPYSTSKNITGCVGFANRGFLGRADVAVWKGEQTMNMTLEDCDRNCLNDPVCHSFIFRNHTEDQDGLCELWTRSKTVDDLATTPSYDTYICEARAAGVDFLDAEYFPNREVFVANDSGIVPRSDGQGGRFTPSTCYKSCITDPGCHVFEYSSEQQSCTLWSSDVSERNLVFVSESEGKSTYILPCHGKGEVCACPESWTSKLRISCQCGNTQCGVDQYCFVDGRCSNSPVRRLSTCEAPPAPQATPAPTARPATPAPTHKATSDCADTANGALDPYKDGCSAYVKSMSWCGNYDDVDFSSKVMCCACGGGTAGATLAPTRSPTPTPTSAPDPDAESCEDTGDGATDSYNTGCSVYTNNKGWCGNYNDADFSSQLMCCACGGGTTADPDEDGCADTSNGAVDAQNDGCGVYKQRTDWCGKFDDADFSAGNMCCACHGLVPTPAPTHNPANCGDTAGDAVDSYKTGCALYTSNPGWCGKYNDADFSSELMCCTCGGGAATSAPTPWPGVTTTKKKDDSPSSSPTPPPPPGGDDSATGVVDGAVAQHPVLAYVIALALTSSAVLPVLA